MIILPKLDGDWVNNDGLLFNPPPLDPIKIDEDGGTALLIAIWCGGRINNPPAELVGTMLT